MRTARLPVELFWGKACLVASRTFRTHSGRCRYLSGCYAYQEPVPKLLGKTVQTGKTRHERGELLSRLTNDPF